MSPDALRPAPGRIAPFARLGTVAGPLSLLLACQGLTAYNAVPGSDTDPDVNGGDADTDADADADADADSDVDVVVLDISEVAPDWGNNKGGTEVTIRGGPFDKTARVWFGAKEAEVTFAGPSKVVATAPRSTETGAVDVKVTTETGEGTGTSAFTYWADGTGSYGAYGFVEWYHMVGSYWDGTPSDFGFAQMFFAEPNSAPPWRVYYSGSKDSCKSEYEFAGELLIYDLGASSLKLELPTGATMSLPPDPDNAWLYATELSPAQFKQNGTYGLEEVIADGFPPVTNPALVVTPASFSVTQPAVSGSTPPTITKSLALQWQTSGAGDYVLVILNRYSGSSVVETVTCVATDDGAFQVPSSAWTGWSSGSQMDVLVGRAKEATGTFQHNDATSGVLGVYWVYGAGFQQ